jgi:glyoxylase-like metal-dependent hydrolase (beta-lactamase superfamily II)
MTTVLDGLHCLPLPIPFPDSPVNVYLAEGEPLTLIDCGTRTDETYRALVDHLADRGYKVSDIQRLLITHHHTDHSGLAERIVAESGAEVWAHPLTVPWLEKPTAARQHLEDFTDAFFKENGVPGPVIATMKTVNHYLVTLAGTTRVTCTITEGDSVELAGQHWQVYHTPGHAGDLICLYQPDTRVLLSSDHLMRDIRPNPLIEAPRHPGEPRPRPLLNYVREIQRIAALDIDIAYTGHGEPITNLRELVESRLNFYHQRAEKLLGLFEDQPRTLYELTQSLFPKRDDSQAYLTLSEVSGHIDLLEQEGRIGSALRDNVVYWYTMR